MTSQTEIALLVFYYCITAYCTSKNEGEGETWSEGSFTVKYKNRVKVEATPICVGYSLAPSSIQRFYIVLLLITQQNIHLGLFYVLLILGIISYYTQYIILYS